MYLCVYGSVRSLFSFSNIRYFFHLIDLFQNLITVYDSDFFRYLYIHPSKSNGFKCDKECFLCTVVKNKPISYHVQKDSSSEWFKENSTRSSRLFLYFQKYLKQPQLVTIYLLRLFAYEASVNTDWNYPLPYLMNIHWTLVYLTTDWGKFFYAQIDNNTMLFSYLMGLKFKPFEQTF